MNPTTLNAQVQYNDYRGTVAADYHDTISKLSELARRFDINTEKYFIFGIEIHYGENRQDELSGPHIRLLAHDTAISKAGSVDHISEYVKGNDGTLPYAQFEIDATIEDVVKCLKRFDVVLHNRHIEGVTEYRLDESF